MLQVLIRVSRTGVNPAETYIRNGAYTVLPPLPYVPGGDAAGVVEEVGGKVRKLKFYSNNCFTILDTSKKR